jgi:hypothetical protein
VRRTVEGLYIIESLDSGYEQCEDNCKQSSNSLVVATLFLCIYTSSFNNKYFYDMLSLVRVNDNIIDK